MLDKLAQGPRALVPDHEALYSQYAASVKDGGEEPVNKDNLLWLHIAAVLGAAIGEAKPVTPAAKKKRAEVGPNGNSSDGAEMRDDGGL